MPVHPDVARRLFFRHRYRVTLVAAMLAVVAGFVNAIAIVLADHPVSHHTGTIARLSRDIGDGLPLDLPRVLPILGAFFVGAALSGAIVGTRYLLPRRRYGAVLLLEGAMLAVTAAIFRLHPAAGLLLAAAACGLQNGMANNFYGVVVRTTHVSGLLTDLAVLTGHWLARRPVEGWRAVFQASIITGFLSGGILGTLAARHGGPTMLAIPAVMCLSGGAGYIALTARIRAQRLQRRRARRA